jgi:PPE-repeat protein
MKEVVYLKLLEEIKNWSTYKNSLFNTQVYQQKYVDENGIKYFITVNHWVNKTSLMVACVKFKRGFDIFNIEYIILETTTLKQMESFFDEIWTSMRCDYESYKS